MKHYLSSVLIASTLTSANAADTPAMKIIPWAGTTREMALAALDSCRPQDMNSIPSIAKDRDMLIQQASTNFPWNTHFSCVTLARDDIWKTVCRNSPGKPKMIVINGKIESPLSNIVSFEANKYSSDAYSKIITTTSQERVIACLWEVGGMIGTHFLRFPNSKEKQSEVRYDFHENSDLTDVRPFMKKWEREKTTKSSKMAKKTMF